VNPGPPGSAPAFAVIAGGGTGGHVYPAIAVAEELAGRGHPRDSIRFVGSRRGLEATAVPAAGFDIDLLPGRGLRRALTPANVGAVLGAAVALVRSWWILRRWRPRVVVGVGGYASLPCVVAARARRIPVVVHEQNAAPGLANRVAVRLGARPAASLPGTPLRGATLVGNPVRAAILGVERRPDARRPLVLVFGGSLGARRVNEAVAGLARRWRDRGDLAIRHVTGRRDHADFAARAGQGEGHGERGGAEAGPGATLDYSVVAYEDHMEDWYAKASLVVSRAGAVTVAELTAAGVPSVLVPLPGAPGDHQTRNALALVDAGAAVVLPDAECDAERLAVEVDALLGDADRLERMGAAASALARPDATARLADLVEEVARGG
jgi:UDP-N-acetylglucosamine--N-acetylmuramyl-(pentapeptide) pyrophosphoryl-undecaprenol N-acetylglucosamine transferase